MKKEVIICDRCGNEVDAGGALMRLNYTDARKGAKAADLCAACSEEMPGKPVARRGRKPKAA